MNLYESFKKSLKEGSWEDALRTGKVVNLGGKENYTPTDFKYDGDKVYYKNSALSGNTWAEHPNNIDKIIDHIKNSEAEGFKATVIDEETSVEPVDMNKVIDNDMTIKELDDTAQWLYDYDRDEWDKFTDNELIELAKLCQITPNSFGRAYDDEVFDEMDKRGLKLHESEESSLKEAAGSLNFAQALLDLFKEVYDGMGDMYAADEWAEVLADSYDIDSEDKEADTIILEALNKMDDASKKDEVDNFIYGLYENDGLGYLKDTLHVYPRNREHIIDCLNTIKQYASEPEKVDQAISELQDVNMDIRTTANEFQKYLHDNYKPWTVLGTTTGPRTYTDLFSVPVDYDIVGADYFNYAGRPNDMLDNIGYGWKQTDNGMQADLIGYKTNYNGNSAVYDNPPVKYGYSAVITPENKEEKFKEMAAALIKKATEIKKQYGLKETELKEADGSRLIGGRYRTMSELRDLFKEYADHFETKGNRIKGNTPEDSYNRGWELGKADAYKLAAFEIENNVDPKLLGEAANLDMNTTSLYIDINALAKYAELYLQDKLGYANVYKEPGKQYTYMVAIRRDDDSVDKYIKLQEELFNESEKLNEGNYGNIYLAEVGYNGVVGTCRGIGNSKEEAKENAFKLFKQDYPYVVEELMQKEEYADKSEIEAVEEYYGLNTFDMSSGAANESGSKLNEADLGYKEKLGGDPEDYISDIQSIKDKLNELDADKFATKLAYEVWEQFDDTCDYQIQSTKDRFLNESYNYIGKDTGEAGRSDKSHMEHTFTVYDCFGEVETFKSKEEAEKYIEEHKNDDLYTDPEYGCENGPEFRIEEDDIEVNNKKIVIKDDLAESEKVKESEKTLAVSSWTFTE